MALTIKNFKVTNLISGNIQQSGRRTLSHLETMLSTKKFLDDLIEKSRIQGTPDNITGGPFFGEAHMSTRYIRISKEYGNNTLDSLFCSTKLRITKVSGTTSAQNTICYAWSNNLDTNSEDLIWNVLFANCNDQENGDYIDIELPDNTQYPNLYLSIIIINDIWKNKTIINENQKICSISGNKNYFSINPQKSNADIGQSHFIVIQGFNQNNSIQNRICLGIEDWYFGRTDNDYNDVVLSIQDAFLDNNNINETQID